MKWIKILVGVLIAAALLAAGVGVYMYRGSFSGVSTPPPQVQPDNAIIAGPITDIGRHTITIQKQDGSLVTVTIGSSTSITGDAFIRGETVLVTPDVSNPSVAASILIVPPPPKQ